MRYTLDMNKLAKLLLLSSFIGTIAECMLIPVWAIFTDKVGGDVLDIGIGSALFPILTGITIYLLGKSDYYEKNIKSMVFWGFLIAGIGEFSYILVSNKWELFFVQALIGLAVGILNPAWDALYAEDESQTHAKKWSFWSGGISFITGFGMLLGSWVLSVFGWNTLFITMGIFDMIAVYYAYQVLIYKEETL